MPATVDRPDRAARAPRPARRAVPAALTAAAAALLARGVANVYRFRVRRERLELPGLRRPLRLLYLADLHYGLWLREGSVRAWVRAARALRPDLIAFGGDYVQGRPTIDAGPLADLLAPLEAPLGVWGVWGNHDHAWYSDRPERLARVLAGAGVRLLVNAHARPRDDLWLAGVDDVSTGDVDVRAALDGVPAEAACVLLCHDPEALPRLEGLRRPPELVLCGHTHGGQLRLPGGVGALPLGWQADAPAPAFVSSGLGVGLLPLRANCPAEMVLFELRPATPRRPPPG